MKKLFNSALFVLFSVSGFSQTGTITVNIDGINSTKGKIEIGLYDKKENFMVHSFKGVSLSPSKSGVTYTFDNVPSGTYAIAIWHDEDEDK